MKTLVVYYSKTGHTEAIAKIIASEMGADVEQIVEPGAKRGGILGFLRSGRDGMKQRKSVIAPPVAQACDYDLVIIGSPVWGGNLVPAVRTYLSSVDLTAKRVALFCTMGSGGDARTFESMKGLTARAQFSGELSIKQEELKDEVALRGRIRRWLEPIRPTAT